MQDAVPNSDQPDDDKRLPAPHLPMGPRALAPIRQQQALSLDVRHPQEEDDEDEIDLKGYWRILVKRRWMVIGVVLIVGITALVGTLLMTPIYRSTAVIQIDRDVVQVVEVQGMPAVEGAADSNFYQTQYELLRSRALAEKVVAQLNLVNSKQLESLAPVSPWTRLLHLGRSKSSATPVASGDATAAKRRAVGLFRAGISIEPMANSHLVRINYDSPDPVFSTKAANAIADAFISGNLERRFGSSSYARKYLEEHLQDLKLKLEDSERKLVAFAQKEQIVSSGDGGSLSEQNLGSINAALSQARQDRIKAEARWKQVQASPESVLAADASENSILKTLQESRAKLSSDYQEKLLLYKPAYPLMLQLKSQIDEVDKQIATELGNIRASVKAQYSAAVEQEKLLSDQLDSLKTEVLDTQNRSIQYNIYKREVDTNRQLYDGLLQRYKEIGVAGGVTNNNMSMVDRADVGYRFKPSVSRNLSMGLVFGLMLGIVLAMLLEYIDDTVKTPEDIEKLLHLSLLGVIPKLKDGLTPERAVEDPRSAFCESYRSVRTALQFSTEQGVPRVMLVTSAVPSEGKSTTSLTLARNFAQLGKSVLLVDADLRNPSLHRAIGGENSVGLSNLLSGAAKASDVINVSKTPNLSFIFSGPLPPNPAELLSGSKLLSLLTIAGQKYDQVIIDAPPVMGLADAPILSHMAAGTLLVVEAGETRVGLARNAIKRLLAARGRVVGAVLTKYDAKFGSYGTYGGHDYYSYGGESTVKRLR